MKRASLPCCVRQSIAVTDVDSTQLVVLKEFQGFKKTMLNIYKQTSGTKAKRLYSI